MRTPVRRITHGGRHADPALDRLTLIPALLTCLLAAPFCAMADASPPPSDPAMVGAGDGGGAVVLHLTAGPQGGPLAGALVSLAALEAPAAARRARTGAAGGTRWDGLGPGRYGIFLGDEPAPGARLGEVRVMGGETVRADIHLRPAPAMERVVVPAAPWSSGQVGPSHSRLTRGDLTSAPAAFGDPMRALSSAAGLAVQSDLKSELRIRGGDAADTAVLVDGLPVLQPYHFAGGAGSASTLDAEALSEVRIQSGAFSAEHGDTLAGVVDFVTRDLPARHHGGRVAAGTLAAQAAFEGPAGEGAYLVSARWSDLGLYRRQVESDARALSLHDLNAAWRRPLGEATRLEVGLLENGNRFEQDLGTAGAGIMDGRSRGFRARIDRSAGARGLWRIQMSDGDLTVQTTAGEGLRQRQDLSRRDLRVVYMHLAGRGHRLQAGASVTRMRGWMRGDVPDGYGTVESSVARDTGVTGLFFEDQAQAGDRVAIRIGARADRGPGSGHIHVSPRFGLDVVPAPGWMVRAAAGRFVQFPRLEQEFLAAGGTLRPQVADHLVLGVERSWGADLRLSLEGYVKTLRDPIGETVNRFVDFPERMGRFDTGRIRGADLSLSGSRGPDWRWRLCAGLLRGDQERAGARTALNTEQRHAASVHLTRSLGGGWEAGALLRYASGLPYTPQEPRTDGITWEKQLGILNSARLPASARLDLRLARSLPTERGALRFYLEILNATNRDNVRSIDLEQDSATGDFYRITDFQAPLTPVFGFASEF